MSDRDVISDEAWAFIAPLLPDSTGRRGGQWRDHRQVLEGIAWRFRTGSPGRGLPARVGPVGRPIESPCDHISGWSVGQGRSTMRMTIASPWGRLAADLSIQHRPPALEV